MAIIIGPEQPYRHTIETTVVNLFVCSRDTLSKATHTQTHTLDYMWRLSGHQQIIIIGLEWKASLTRQIVFYHPIVSWFDIFTFKALGISLKACNWNWLKNVHIFSFYQHPFLYERTHDGCIQCSFHVCSMEIYFVWCSHLFRTNSAQITLILIALYYYINENIFKRPLIFGWIVIDCSFLWQLVSFI